MKKAIVAVTATLLLLTTAGCSSSQINYPQSNITSETNTATQVRYQAIIDVRTEEEWATGRLEDALLISVASPDFLNKISTLDKTKSYYVYCRSGNRAGQAIQLMQEAGFTGDLINGGSLEAASAELGLNIVK